ncbi:NAD(P)-binding protein [Ophiobolus disseminans]|uniref:NAD(P)-binding protein n=1 Tax=Ophiobolus disseminans TaxID=1469910 RepID=A0A6A7A4N1_9PLEO|nr:NAD(P)-binding protein [Ophiobolus disseminans]
MRALIRAGPSKTLTLDTNHPEPTSNNFPNSYIVKVKATALTREELIWPEPLESAIPIPGYDLTCIVTAVPQSTGPKVFKVGDEVYGLTNPHKQGNARDFAEVDERDLALKPRNLTWEEAAAVPLSALSAYQGLFIHGGLSIVGDGSNESKRVLVTAASGGVGIWAVQLAHQAGVHVTGTCGPSNIDFVKSLGADTVLDYRKTDLLTWVEEEPEQRSFDVVIDCIGGQTLADAWKCLKKDGRMISVAEPADLKKPANGIAEGVQSVWFIVEANHGQLSRITNMIEGGKCKAQVDQVFELEEWEAAFVQLESGHTKGKVVLKL